MAALSVSACDEDGGGPGPIVGTRDIGSTGGGGTVDLSVRGDAIELDRIESQAMNTMDLDRESQLGPHRLGGARWGACGARIAHGYAELTLSHLWQS